MSELTRNIRYRIMGEVFLVVDAPSPQGRVQIEIDGEIVPRADYPQYAITMLERELSVEYRILPEQWPTERRMLLLIEDESRDGSIVVTNMDDGRYLVPRRQSEDPEIAAIEIKWSKEWKMEMLPSRYPG